MTVVVPNPTEVGVVGAAAAPVEAGDANRRILGRLDGLGLDPAMTFVVTILKGEGAEVAMEHGERVDPTP